MRAGRALGAAALAFLASCAAAPLVRAQAAPAEPPLNIAADNMTGGRGPEGDVVFLNGNIRITRGRSVLTADLGRYLRTLGMLYLDGNVKMVDSTTTVTCGHASYSENDDLLELQDDVVVLDREATLRAPHGRYDRRAGRADLDGGVSGQDRYQRLTADRVTYVRDSLRVRAFGNCRGFDDDHKIQLESARLDYDRGTHEAVATGSPVMRALDEKGKATVIRAITLRTNTETRIAEAIDSVTVERDTLRGRADYARFDDVAQTGLLVGRPRVWDNETTMSGDTLELYSVRRELNRVVVKTGAVMDYKGARPGTIGESSRLVGKRADIYITKDAIDSLVATGDARNDYVAPPRNGKTPERNTAIGDTITVFFKDRKIDRARVEGGAHGEYRLAVDPADTNAVKREVVTYEGARITFVVPKSQIVLDRRALLRYGDLQLQARRVEYDVDQQTLVAEGSPELVDRGDKVEGHLMTYDMNTRIGTIYHAETAYEKGLYHGEKIRKVNEKELDVFRGSYSTCSLEEPHYHFAAKWMKIFLKDKLIAKPVVFYIRNVPILALPFWVFPIKPGRHSGFLFPQVDFGFSNQAGQFVRNAGYYWAPNDYMDLTVGGDYYRGEPSWVLRADGLYKRLYQLDGDLHGTFARNERLSRDDYDFNFNHAQVLTPRTRVVARGQFVSSRDYSGSNLYGRTLAQRVNSILRSGFALSHDADWASFSAVVDRTEYLNADDALADPDGLGPVFHSPALGTLAPLPRITQTLPSLSVSFPTRTLGSLGFLRETALEKPLSTVYTSLSARFTGTEDRRSFIEGFDRFTGPFGADSIGRLGTRATSRRGAAGSLSLSDQRQLFGWLSFAPVFNANMAVFDFDEQGNKVVPAATWNTGLRGSFNLYGSWRPTIGRLVGLRHVITPSASWSYSPEFTSLTFRDASGRVQPRFRSFGDIGLSGAKQSFLNFGVSQRLQVKYRKGEKVERLDNLVSLSAAGSYNLLWRETSAKHGLSPLSWSMFVQTPSFMTASFGWTTDFYEGRPLRSLGYNFGTNLASRRGRATGANPDLPFEDPTRAEQEERESFAEAWSVGFAYSYAGGYSGRNWNSQQTANATLHFQLSPGWGVEYATSANLTRREVQAQRFGVTRDIHCWTASFSRSFIQNGEAEYYFRLQVKDQKEIYYERGTRGGSVGGIQ